MAEVLASLKKIGGNGEQYTETSLWTNPNTSVDFATQNVTLSDSISNYKYIKFVYLIAKGGTVEMDLYVATDKLRTTTNANGAPALGLSSFGTSSGNLYPWSRVVYYVSDTSIHFNPARTVNVAITQDQRLIPKEILGINELAHQTVVGKYAVTDIQKITANTVPTFATRGKPLAIWFTFGNRSSAVMQAFTNVNPTTGEINNNEVYYAYYSGTSQLAQWTLTTNTFVVTDNSISTSASLSSSDRWGYIGYTYE